MEIRAGAFNRVYNVYNVVRLFERDYKRNFDYKDAQKRKGEHCGDEGVKGAYGAE
jgi:hypothetical protein